MGLIQAVAGAVGGMLGDQWKDFYTVPAGLPSTAALFAAVEGVEGAELDLLIVDPVAGMKASITHVDYGDTRRIAQTMRANGLEITETGTLDDQGRIVSDITIGGGR